MIFAAQKCIWQSEQKKYHQHAKLDIRQNYFNSAKLLGMGFKGLFTKPASLFWATPAETDRFMELKPGDSFDIGGEVIIISFIVILH